uniref:Uncharacterized protein n=1 Tax=Phasianus colchicus TaxID=9054 RepID=A0A669QJD1_PHACC
MGELPRTRTARAPSVPVLTHAAGQLQQHVVAAQLPQELQQLTHGGSAGTAALPLVQQRGRGIGQRLQPPDLQVVAAQLLRQRRPVGCGRRPRVEVKAEAAPHAVVEGHHGHGVQIRRLGAGSGARAHGYRGHGRAALATSPGAALSLPASPRLLAACRPASCWGQRRERLAPWTEPRCPPGPKPAVGRGASRSSGCSGTRPAWP